MKFLARKMSSWSMSALVACSCAKELGSEASRIEEYARERERMVREQLQVPERHITNSRVLEAMRSVPRHEFVPPRQRPAAYQDSPLPIGKGQTISQPYIVAFMTEKLDPKATDRVLEIGTGSGYQAAILSCLVSNVYSVEIVPSLGERARATLAKLGYTNVFVKVGDGYLGWPEFAPFDSIIVTCAPQDVPQPLVDQLKDGGRMIIPVGSPYDCELYILQKQGTNLASKAILPVRFVPMTRERSQNKN